MSTFFNNFSNEKVLIIAEIGVNHDGSLEKAKELVSQAYECGADAVKFQLFSASKLSHNFTPKVEYQKKTDTHESHFSMLESLEFSREQHQLIEVFCKNLGIMFSTTAYDVSDIDFLASLDMPFIKIASADIVDTPLIRKAAQSGKPILLSTGMATKQEIINTVNILNLHKSDFCLMHCTSEYPASSDHVFMNRIDYVSEVSNGVYGYSDHTTGYLAALMAIAKGARVIEKHFTLDKTGSGPDHLASADPQEFKIFVDKIRECQVMFGDGKFFRTAAEDDMAKTSRKSIYLAKDMEAGEIISMNDIYLRRPGGGLSGQNIDDLCNKKLKYNLKAGHAITSLDLLND